MESNLKIIEIFHYFNIESEIDSVFGNWAVSKKGDVVNYLYPFFISSTHLNDCDWEIEIPANKKWFQPECKTSLGDAIHRAQVIRIQ
jgi:hypothetical protein